MKNLLPSQHSLRVCFAGTVIARKPALSAVEWVAISYPSKDRGCSVVKTPLDDAHSFDFDEVGAVIPM
jgi:hypothetical protein